MNNWKTWNEYIDSRSKTREKASTKKVADYDGPTPASPEKSQAGRKLKDDGKGMEDVAGSKTSKPAPYKAAGKDPGMQVADGGKEKGLGDDGDKNLIYSPDTDASGKEAKTWPESFDAFMQNKNEAVGPPMGMDDEDMDDEDMDDEDMDADDMDMDADDEDMDADDEDMDADDEDMDADDEDMDADEMDMDADDEDMDADEMGPLEKLRAKHSERRLPDGMPDAMKSYMNMR